VTAVIVSPGVIADHCDRRRDRRDRRDRRNLTHFCRSRGPRGLAVGAVTAVICSDRRDSARSRRPHCARGLGAGAETTVIAVIPGKRDHRDYHEPQCVRIWRRTSHGDHGLAVTAVTGMVTVTAVTDLHRARAKRSPPRLHIRLEWQPPSLARWSLRSPRLVGRSCAAARMAATLNQNV
jgi:hypothetical protein